MKEVNKLLLNATLKSLRLPTMHAEFEVLAREAGRPTRSIPAAPDVTGGGGPFA
jgi:hypothetical protein